MVSCPPGIPVKIWGPSILAISCSEGVNSSVQGSDKSHVLSSPYTRPKSKLYCHVTKSLMQVKHTFRQLPYLISQVAISSYPEPL